MKVHKKNDDAVMLREKIGGGRYKGHDFELFVSTNLANELTGVPVVRWDNGTMVMVELDDFISTTFDLAFGRESGGDAR